MADWIHWTFAEMQTLRTMNARGATFSQISKALPGRSRAACISKAHKLGIFGEETPAMRRRKQAERVRAARVLMEGLHA